MSYVDHANRHNPRGSDAPPPGDWYYATPLSPASTPADYVSGAAGNAAFENSWANVALPDASYSPLRWRFVTKGRVEIVGSIDGGEVGVACVTLPAAFRPEHDVVSTISTTDGSQVLTVSISASSGEVVVVGMPATGIVDTDEIADGAVTSDKLEDSGVTADTYGDSTHVAQITVNAKGIVTAAAEVAMTYYVPGGTDVALADGGTGTSLADPNADRIMFWDDSAGHVDWLTAGTGLTITGTSLTASGGAPSGSAGGALDGSYPNPGLAATVAGSGLAESSDVLSVNVDGTTIEINSDTLRLKDTGVGAATYGDATHVAQVTVNAKGQLTAASDVAITASGIGGISTDGWVDATGTTWTYASGSGGGAASFTIAGVDHTARFSKGTRIRLKQGGAYKYFVVTGSSFSTNTTVNIMAGTDYTLANSAITDNYYSNVLNPEGYPGWFTYAPASTGFSSTTLDTGRFAVNGRVCFIELAISGTSNSANFTCSLPVTVSSGQLTDPMIQIQRLTDNGVATTVGALRFGSGTTTLTFGKALNAAGGFTASGTKGFVGYSFYEI